jgi:hypothetical protein
MAIDRSEVKQIADAAIRHYIDAIHTCTDLAECQVQAALLAVDEYTARHSTAPVVQDIEHGTEPSLSDVRQVLNRINRHSAAEVARMVRALRLCYDAYLAGDADSELARHIREEILRPYGQKGGEERG